MHWILQENICQEAKWQELVNSLERLNISYSIHKVVPFSGELIPPAEINTNKVICYGSTAMANIAKENNWYPGVIEVPDFEIQLNSPWREHFLNKDAKFYYMWQLPNIQLTEDLYFIKPSNDSKFIAGQIMTPAEIKDWAHKVVILGENNGSNVNKDSIVQISSPKNIRKEARFWIVDDQVTTYSLYKLGRTVIQNKLLVDAKFSARAHWFCSIMSTNYWRPADAYCLDLCEVTDDEYKIVEINNINSSGLYDSDVIQIVGNLQGFYK